jgi:hypothetical protein
MQQEIETKQNKRMSAEKSACVDSAETSTFVLHEVERTKKSERGVKLQVIVCSFVC